MKLQKPARIKNKKLMEQYRQFQCVVQSERCIPGGDVCFEHWRTVGAGGDDSEANGNPMCFGCHELKGRMGIRSFWKKYEKNIQRNRIAQGLLEFDPGF